jgi:hypothetical protein
MHRAMAQSLKPPAGDAPLTTYPVCPESNQPLILRIEHTPVIRQPCRPVPRFRHFLILVLPSRHTTPTDGDITSTQYLVRNGKAPAEIDGTFAIQACSLFVVANAHSSELAKIAQSGAL